MKGLIETIDEMYETGTPAEIEAWMLEQRGLIGAKLFGGDEVSSETNAGNQRESEMRDYITICNELGSLYREQGRYRESLDNYEKALATSTELLGAERSYEHALILLNEAGTYRYKRDFDNAFCNYIDAEAILIELGMDDTFEYASLLNNKALALLDEGVDFDHALDLAISAADIVSRQRPGTVDEAISFVNLASMALRMGELAKADDYAHRAVGLYEGLGVVSGHYPAAINVLAAVALKKGNLEEALAGFERSAELTKRNFGENRDYAAAMRSVAYVRNLMEDGPAIAE